MFRSLAFIGVLIYVIVVLVRHIPGGFVPEEDQGYIMVNAQLPDAASLERTDAVMKKAESDSGGERGDRRLQHDQRLLAAHLARTPRTWASSSCSSSRGRSGTARRRTPAEVVAALNRAFAQRDPGRAGARVRAAGDSGARHRRRLHHAAAGSQRRPARVPGRADAALHGGGAEAAGDRTHQHALPRQRAAGLRRHRSQQGAEVRRAAERRQHHARRAARQLLRERLQQVRPRLQGLRAGRAGVPAGSEAARAVLRPEPGGRHGPARHAGHHGARLGTGVHQPLQPVPLGRAHRRARAPAFRRRRRSTRSKRRRERCCRRT